MVVVVGHRGGLVVGVVVFRGGAVVVVVVVAVDCVGAVGVVVVGGLLVRTVNVAVGAGVAGAAPPVPVPVPVPKVVPWPRPEDEDEDASCEPPRLEGLGGVVGAVVAPARPAGGVGDVNGTGPAPWPARAGGACWALRTGVEAGPVNSRPRTTDRVAASTLVNAMARLRRRCVPGVLASAAARPAVAAAAGIGCPKSGDSNTSSRVA